MYAIQTHIFGLGWCLKLGDLPVGVAFPCAGGNLSPGTILLRAYLYLVLGGSAVLGALSIALAGQVAQTFELHHLIQLQLDVAIVQITRQIYTSVFRMIGVPVAVPIGSPIPICRIAGRALVSGAGIRTGRRRRGFIPGVIPGAVGGISSSLCPGGKRRHRDGQTGHHSRRQHQRYDFFHLSLLLFPSLCSRL